jgi:paraquat-inducible protein B
MAATVSVQIPDSIYQRLVNTVNATGQSLQEIMLHALKVSSSPDWDNVPDEFKTDLAVLDRLEDEALWKIATTRKTPEDMVRHDELLERNQDAALTLEEKLELMELRSQADGLMLRKVQAALYCDGEEVFQMSIS